MELRLCILVMAILPVSGCFESDDAKPGPGASESSSQTRTSLDGSTEPPLPDLPVTPVANNSLAFSQCSSWTLSQAVPPSMHSGSRPSGWEPADPTRVFGGISVHGYHCDRISVGPFERGPVHFVVEDHVAATFPPACKRHGEGQDGLASTFWIDDQEIATYLNVTYGIPVLFAPIQGTDENIGDVERHTWTWAQAGQEATTVTVVSDPAMSRRTEAEKWFWPVGQGIAKLEVHFEFVSPTGGIVEHAMFEPPMLMAEVAGGAHLGKGPWYPSGDGTGEFTMFRDRFCEEPV